MTAVDTFTETKVTARSVQPKSRHVLVRLYHGQTSFNFVGRFKIWVAISLTVIIIGLISLFTQGLNFSIDFEGGTSWTVLAPSVSVNQVRNLMNGMGLSTATVEKLGGKTITVQDRIVKGSASEIAAKKTEVTDKLAKLAHVSQVDGVSIQDVGPTWGSYITNKAIEALIVFLILIALYITIRFEWKMAVGALVALIHDILVTVGVYSLSGFQVTPDTVVAFLTILGYSLYDTMVVFDRVQDNTDGIGAAGRMTYSSIVNLSMNQVLARSINTSLVAIMPILSVLVIGAQFLGATTLQYFGLALLIGLTTGAYSSIFIASPLVAKLKEMEGRYKTIRIRLEARGEADTMINPYLGVQLSSDRRNSGQQLNSDIIRPSKISKSNISSPKIRLSNTTARSNTGSKAGIEADQSKVVVTKKDDMINDTSSNDSIDDEYSEDQFQTSDDTLRFEDEIANVKSQSSNKGQLVRSKTNIKKTSSKPKSAKKRR
jgi:preprotein translocase subunit SecF